MNKIRISIILVIFLMQISNVAIAQIKESKKNVTNATIEMNYRGLLGEDFSERDRAVAFLNELKKEQLNPAIFQATISLLRQNIEQRKGGYKVKKESISASSEGGDDIGESYAMYHSNLCELSSKSGETQILPLLVEYCLDAKALLNFGDDAVEPVMNILTTPSVHPFRKARAILILGEMVKPKKEGYVARGEIRSNIKNALIKAMTDDDNNARQVAVKALGESRDADIIPTLEKIAQDDPYFFKKRDRSTGNLTTRCPVRDEAQRALEKIKKKGMQNN